MYSFSLEKLPLHPMRGIINQCQFEGYYGRTDMFPIPMIVPTTNYKMPFQFSTISRLFKEVMEDYSREQEDYRDKSKDRIQKQLQYGMYISSCGGSTDL